MMELSWTPGLCQVFGEQDTWTSPQETSKAKDKVQLETVWSKQNPSYRAGRCCWLVNVASKEKTRSSQELGHSGTPHRWGDHGLRVSAASHSCWGPSSLVPTQCCPQPPLPLPPSLSPLSTPPPIP